MLASIVMTAANLAVPMITRRIVDDALVPVANGSGITVDARRVVARLSLLLLTLRLVSWVAEWVHGWITTGLGARVTARVRSELYRHLELLPLRYHDERSVGASMSHVMNDAGTLQHFLVRGVPTLLTNILTVAGIVATMSWMSGRLTIAVLVPLPLLAYWSAHFWRHLNPMLERWLRVVASFSARTHEDLAGMRVTRAFVAERRQIERFERLNQTMSELKVATNRERAVLMATVGVITGAGVAALWLVGGLGIERGEITLGTLLAFYGFVFMLHGPLQSFGQIASWVGQALTGA